MGCGASKLVRAHPQVQSSYTYCHPIATNGSTRERKAYALTKKNGWRRRHRVQHAVLSRGTGSSGKRGFVVFMPFRFCEGCAAGMACVG